jgi:predicted DNA-binding WGR domain protein
MITLHRVGPDHKIHRFYHIRVEQTLFGGWALIREWGRIENGSGQTLSVWFETMESAKTAMRKLEAAKRRRGYC